MSLFPYRNIQNNQNYYRLMSLYLQTGGKVLIKVFEWLYIGEIPPETYLFNLTKNKTNGFQQHEKYFLKNLQNGEITFVRLDFSLLFRIIKCTCGLAPYQDIKWSKDCPRDKGESLEQLLYKLKAGRNDVAHQTDDMFNITDEDMKVTGGQLKQLYVSVLHKAGHRANVTHMQIEVVIKLIELEINKITEGLLPVGVYVDNVSKQDIEFSSKKDFPGYRNLASHPGTQIKNDLINVLLKPNSIPSPPPLPQPLSPASPPLPPTPPPPSPLRNPEKLKRLDSDGINRNKRRVAQCGYGQVVKYEEDSDEVEENTYDYDDVTLYSRIDQNLIHLGKDITESPYFKMWREIYGA